MGNNLIVNKSKLKHRVLYKFSKMVSAAVNEQGAFKKEYVL
jgi:hypothetical protein